MSKNPKNNQGSTLSIEDTFFEKPQEHFAQCSFHRALKSNYFGNVLLKNFASTWNNLLKHCISNEFLLMEGYVQAALRKELRIAPFVERFKTTTLGKSS